MIHSHSGHDLEHAKDLGSIRSGGSTELLFLPSSYITQIPHTLKHRSKIRPTTIPTSPLFSTRNRHQIKVPDQKSSQSIVASIIIIIIINHTESPIMANNTKTTTQTQYDQSNIKLNKMPFIENWISHPEKQYDMEQNKSDASSARCTTPELNSSSSSAPSIFSTNSASTSTSSKAHNALLAELQRLRTKINQQYHVLRTTSHGVSTTILRPKQQDANDNINVGTETKKHFNGAPRSILKAGRAIKQHLTIHHRHTESSISFEDETQSDFPFALPNFIQTNNYNPEHTPINNTSNDNGTFKGKITFTPVGNTVNKHFVDGYYSHHQKQEATFGEFTPVGDSINPHYIDGEYISCSDKHHDQDRRIPTWIWKNVKRIVYYTSKGYDSMDEDGNIIV
jgi:hypothetical protein